MAKIIISILLISFFSFFSRELCFGDDNGKSIASNIKFTKLAHHKYKILRDTNAYFKHIIQVKTRDAKEIADDNKSFVNSKLNFLFERYRVYSITKPYEYIFKTPSKFVDYSGLKRICELHFK